MNNDWLLEHWQAFRAKQKKLGQTLELCAGHVWRKDGAIELIAKFKDDPTAVAMLLAAGYRRRNNIFKP